MRKRCFYCGKPLSRRNATTDHKIPKSRGGKDGKYNTVDCCFDCNQSKGNLLIEEFRLVMAYRKRVLKQIQFPFWGEKQGDSSAR